MEPLTTLSVGHVTHDRFDARVVPGGSAWYAARCFKALGAEARLVTAVGRDFQAPEAWEGLEVHARREGRTTLFTNEYPPGQPRLQTVASQAPPVTPAGLPDAWRSVDVLFLAPVIGEVDLDAWLEAVDARWVALGVQGWMKRAGDPVADRPGASRVVPVDWPPAGRALAGVQVACLSSEDLAGRRGAFDRLLRQVPLVALTYGRAGCTIHVEGQAHEVPAFDVPEVDPTGAGDTFAAGLLTGLAHGLDPVTAARLGAAAAAEVVQGLGGARLDQVHHAWARLAPTPEGPRLDQDPAPG